MLGVLVTVDRWRARQGRTVRAGLVAPTIRARPALADCAFAITLETQRRHALANRGKIVGGAGCVRLQLVWHALVMPEDGCSIVKAKAGAPGGRTQPKAGARGMSGARLVGWSSLAAANSRTTRLKSGCRPGHGSRREHCRLYVGERAQQIVKAVAEDNVVVNESIAVGYSLDRGAGRPPCPHGKNVREG